uniref:RxLR effector protein n=1 Tax=Phytophthora sojae TaxID=67593 RepID=G1FR66_PHYSO|nr:Avh71 [Phytophthora sojae]
MRISQGLVLLAVSFLVTCEALSSAPDSNEAKISKVASLVVPSQRLLKTHRQPVDDEEDSSEEQRDLTIEQIKAICK